MYDVWSVTSPLSWGFWNSERSWAAVEENGCAEVGACKRGSEVLVVTGMVMVWYCGLERRNAPVIDARRCFIGRTDREFRVYKRA